MTPGYLFFQVSHPVNILPARDNFEEDLLLLHSDTGSECCRIFSITGANVRIAVQCVLFDADVPFVLLSPISWEAVFDKSDSQNIVEDDRWPKQRILF